MRIFNHILMLAVTFCVTACAYTNHFLDEDEVDPDTDTSTVTLENVNIATYDVWTYINLKTGETETHPDATEWIYSGTGDLREAVEEEEITIDWHVAVHRYEFKTNGASVLNTGETSIESVTTLPEGTYTADEVASYEEEVEADNGYVLSMDLSGMMDGNVGYAHNPLINRVLCDGITRTATGSMPPYIYSTEGVVFALKWDDGSWATFQVTGTSNTITSVSNYMSFKFKYNAAD